MIDREAILVALLYARKLRDARATYEQLYPGGRPSPASRAAGRIPARDHQVVMAAQWKFTTYVWTLGLQRARELLAVACAGAGICEAVDLMHAQANFTHFKQPESIALAMIGSATLAEDLERGLRLAVRSGVLPAGRE